MNESQKSPVQELWQTQPTEGTKMTADAIRLRAGNFERKIARRNLRESVAALLVVAFFCYFFATSHNIPFRITWGLFIAGMIWVVVQLRRKGTPRTMPADLGSSTCLDFFRSELERQRDLVKDVWTWYLVPLLPGYAAYNMAHALTFRRPMGLAGLALLDVFFAVMFVVLWKLNVYAARCLQRTIDELPTENPR